MYSLFVSSLKSTFGRHKLMRDYQREGGKDSERGRIEKERWRGIGKHGEGGKGREEERERERETERVVHCRQQSNLLDG